jgi:hypothetical protein
MKSTENNYNEYIYEYRGEPSTPKLVLGFTIWFLLAVYCVYSIIEVYNAREYLDVSRFSYFLYEIGGKDLLYFYFAIIPMSFLLVAIKLLLNTLKNK